MRRRRLRYRKSIKYKVYFTVFLSLIVAIGIGYSALQKNLNITGKTSVVKPIWDVHFENASGFLHMNGSCNSSTSCSKVNTPATISSSADTITVSVTFHEVGDYYEFYTDIVNKGNIDAMGSVTGPGLSGETTENKKYLSISMKYIDDHDIGSNDLIKAGEKVKIRVRIKYIAASTSDVTATFKFQPQYAQATSTGKVRNSTTCSSNTSTSTAKLCRRAATLHTGTCNNTGCTDAGYKSGQTITYGSCGTSGELKSGDAFDCDVNGDGKYDSATERFYYVSDYFDTTTAEFNSSYATLIYYSNVKAGKSDNTSTFYWGDADAQLPIWSKVKLFQYNRRVLNEDGGTSGPHGTDDSSTINYAYGSASSRLLTVQEKNSGCTGECEYLLENTDFTNKNGHGWWLENFSLGGGSSVHHYYSGGSMTNVGVRPAIEVLKTNILY